MTHDDDWLVRALRAHQPRLDDDGFTQRVMAALPPVRAPRRARADWIVLLGAMSLVAGLIVTSYLPLPGSRQAAASSCGLMPGLMVPGVGVLLAQGSGLLSGVFALAILGLGLVQRLSGASACG